MLAFYFHLSLIWLFFFASSGWGINCTVLQSSLSRLAPRSDKIFRVGKIFLVASLELSVHSDNIYTVCETVQLQRPFCFISSRSSVPSCAGCLLPGHLSSPRLWWIVCWWKYRWEMMVLTMRRFDIFPEMCHLFYILLCRALKWYLKPYSKVFHHTSPTRNSEVVSVSF